MVARDMGAIPHATQTMSKSPNYEAPMTPSRRSGTRHFNSGTRARTTYRMRSERLTPASPSLGGTSHQTTRPR
jgi:hypothetical protein